MLEKPVCKLMSHDVGARPAGIQQSLQRRWRGVTWVEHQQMHVIERRGQVRPQRAAGFRCDTFRTNFAMRTHHVDGLIRSSRLHHLVRRVGWCVEGCEAKLTMYPGAIDTFDRAIAAGRSREAISLSIRSLRRAPEPDDTCWARRRGVVAVNRPCAPLSGGKSA